MVLKVQILEKQCSCGLIFINKYIYAHIQADTYACTNTHTHTHKTVHQYPWDTSSLGPLRNQNPPILKTLYKMTQYLYITYIPSPMDFKHCGTPLQGSCLENPMGEGAWWATVHGVARSWTRLSDFTFTFHFHALEKEMATNSSALAWRIPGTGEPGGLPESDTTEATMGSHRVRHDWSDLAAAAAAYL